MSDDINKKDNDEVNETPKTSEHTPETTEEGVSVTSDDKPKTFGKGAKKETGDTEAMDFDKEIESLDEFLMESEEEDDELSLEDDDMLTASNFSGQEKKKSGAGKYVGYFVFLLLLCGLFYGGIVYGPQMFNNPDFEEFQQNMANRSEQFEADITANNNVDSTDEVGMAMPEEGVPTAPPAQDMVDVEPLPSAADEIVLVEENMEPQESVEVAEADIDMPSDEVVVMDEAVAEEAQIERANTIADALAMTQAAETEEMPAAQVDDVVVEEIELTEASEVETATDEELENALNVETQMSADENEGFERTNAVSLTESRMRDAETKAAAEDNLPPLEEEQIAIANDVMEMPEEEITEVVEAVDQVAEETQDVAGNANMTVEAEEALVEEAIEETVETSAESEEPVESEQVAEAVINETEEMVEMASENNSVVEENEITEMEVVSVTESTENSDVPVVGETQNNAMEDIDDTAVVEDMQAASPPAPAPTKKAAPSVETQKVAIKEDPRVEEAQTAYKNGNYTQALTLYNGVLAEDPANTSALTGRQLVTAKMRMAPDGATFETAMVTTSQPAMEEASSVPTSQPTPDTFENVTVSVGKETQGLRQRLQATETTSSSYASSSYGDGRLNSRILSRGQSGMNYTANDDVLLPTAVPQEVVAQPTTEPVRAMDTAKPIQMDDITFNETIVEEQPTPVRAVIAPEAEKAVIAPIPEADTSMPVMEVESKPVMVAPVEPVDTAKTDVSTPEVDAKPALDSELEAMVAEADMNPRNVALAVAIADQFKSQGDNAMAREWYKKALKRDSMYKAGLDRMAIYDSLAGVR